VWETAGIVVVAVVGVAEVEGLHGLDEDRGRVSGPYWYCGISSQDQYPVISVAQKGIAQKYLEHLWSSLRPFGFRTCNTVHCACSGTEGSIQIPL
jgi:hypothetical protein